VDAAPEHIIRRYLDEHGGRADATVGQVLATFHVSPGDRDGRRRVVDALAAAGVVLDRPLDDLGREAKLVVQLADIAPPPRAEPPEARPEPPPPRPEPEAARPEVEATHAEPEVARPEAEAARPEPEAARPEPRAGGDLGATLGRLTASQPAPFWWAAGATVSMVVGALGPWATALDLVSLSGTRGDGWLVILAAAVSAAMLWSYAIRGSRGVLIGSALAGATGLVIGIVDFVDIASRGSGEIFDEEVQLVDPGWGIYVVILASAALVVFSGLLYRRSSSSR
jgi:hypothetical protein